MGFTEDWGWQERKRKGQKAAMLNHRANAVDGIGKRKRRIEHSEEPPVRIVGVSGCRRGRGIHNV